MKIKGVTVMNRKYNFYKLEDAKEFAKKYSIEDKVEYAVIRPMIEDGNYEVIPDDFRKDNEGLETIPYIVWHTTEK